MLCFGHPPPPCNLELPNKGVVLHFGLRPRIGWYLCRTLCGMRKLLWSFMSVGQRVEPRSEFWNGWSITQSAKTFNLWEKYFFCEKRVRRYLKNFPFVRRVDRLTSLLRGAAYHRIVDVGAAPETEWDFIFDDFKPPFGSRGSVGNRQQEFYEMA